MPQASSVGSGPGGSTSRPVAIAVLAVPAEHVHRPGVVRHPARGRRGSPAPTSPTLVDDRLVAEAVGDLAVSLVGRHGEAIPERSTMLSARASRETESSARVAVIVGLRGLPQRMIDAMRQLTDAELLGELEPRSPPISNRHLPMAQEWLPHEWVPWSRGRDFAGEGRTCVDAGSVASCPSAVRAAFEVNLLTEDNLPSYHHELASRFGRDGAWGTWVNGGPPKKRDTRWPSATICSSRARSIRWHSSAIGWRRCRRGGRGRRRGRGEWGWHNGGRKMLRSLVYVAFQELATRVAHRNTGRVADDPVAERLLTRSPPTRTCTWCSIAI